MQLQIIKRPCPTCKTKIGLGLLSVNGEIRRCPKCGELLVDHPGSNLFGFLLFFAGFLLIAGLQYFYGKNFARDAGILVLSAICFERVRKLVVTKKDLVIRNRITHRISYISHADWQEILENTKDRENDFEIIERL